jgi:hypothetical protein
LALLVTAVAVLLVSLDLERCYSQLARLTEREPGYLIGLVASATIIGGLVGIVRLFVDGFSWRRLLLAPLGGCLAGLVAVLIIVSPGPFWRTVLAVGLLLVTTNLLRLEAE